MPKPKAEFTFTLAETFCLGTTDLAIRCQKGDASFWIPRSVLHDDNQLWHAGDLGDLVVQLWFAEKYNYKQYMVKK